jgi:uncharacterized CHY-type Zn-finger protein
MTEEREIRVPYKELTRQSVTCGKCQTEVTVDFMSKTAYQKGDTFECPLCHTAFDSRLLESFLRFQEWLECLEWMEICKQDVIFRIKL